MTHRIKRTIVASTLVLAALWAGAAMAAQPAVLTQIPDNAGVIVVVKNLKQLTTKIANAGTRMKITVPDDLLATLMGRYGIADGLDQNGSAAYVMLDVGKEQANPGPPPMVFVVPASDSKAMLKSIEAKEPDESGIMQVTLANAEQESYAAVAGKYVLLSPQKAPLQEFLAHKGALDKKLSAESAAAFDASDIVLYANMPELGPKAVEGIERARDAMAIQMGMANQNKAQAAVTGRAMGAMFALATQCLTDSNANLVTFRMNDDGATLGGIGLFKADSPMGKFIAAQKPKANNLDGLPDGKLLLAATGSLDPSSASAAINKVIDQIAADPDLRDDPKLPDIKKALDLEKQVLAGFSGQKMALYQPSDPAKGWLNGVTLVDTADPQKTIDAALAMARLNLTSGGNQGMVVEQKTEENAVNIKGVSFLKSTLTYSLSPDAPRQMAAGINMLKSMYGPDGLTMYYGVVGRQVLTVMSNDPKLLEDAVDAAQAGSTALSRNAEIVAGNKNAQPNAQGVVYLPVSRWAALALKQFGLAPADPPADKPAPAPLVISATMTGPNVTTEMYIPMGTVIDLSATIQESFPGLIH